MYTVQKQNQAVSYEKTGLDLQFLIKIQFVKATFTQVGQHDTSRHTGL